MISHRRVTNIRTHIVNITEYQPGVFLCVLRCRCTRTSNFPQKCSSIFQPHCTSTAGQYDDINLPPQQQQCHDLVVSGEPTPANLEPQSEHNKRRYIFEKSE
jgi:hypothetical protein